LASSVSALKKADLVHDILTNSCFILVCNVITCHHDHRTIAPAGVIDQLLNDRTALIGFLCKLNSRNSNIFFNERLHPSPVV